MPILLFSLVGSGDRPVAAAVNLFFAVPAFIAHVFSATDTWKTPCRCMRLEFAR